MTMTEWDGTPWAGSLVVPESRSLIVPEPPVIEAKALVGPGVGFYAPGSIMMHDFTRSPQKLMARAQQAYRSHPWVGSAEAVVTRKVVGLPWHLEDEQGNEYKEGEEPPQVKAFRDVLTHPVIGGRQVSWTSFESLLSRHTGLGGMSYVYLDQQEPFAGTPLRLVYINPTRVWAATDDAGNLTGWVLDAQNDRGDGGTPYTIEEILPFYLDEPDFGHYGIGLYERLITKAQVTNLTDQHAAYILGTGGRIAGIVSPREGTIPDEKFQALVLSFRELNNSPDAAKRTTIMQGPTDFTKTAGDANELQFVELSKMSRDDIFAAWGVPLSQAPISAAVGMNSGDTKGWDEAVLMQGVVHDRVTTIRETIQLGLADRWQKLGVTIKFMIDEPEFDDDTPAYERALKAVDLPLTQNERREIIGEEPLPDYDSNGDPLGVAIYVSNRLTDIGEGPDENGNLAKRPPKPAPPPPPPPGVVPPALAAAGATPPNLLPPGKAQLRPLVGLRARTDERWVPKVRDTVESVLTEQRNAILDKLRSASEATWKRHAKDADYWFGPDKKLLAALQPVEVALADTVTERVSGVLRRSKASFLDRVVKIIETAVAERVVGINQTTREAIALIIAGAFDNGLSPLEAAGLIEASTAFDPARADMIARTETMLAYNDAALGTYREYGVEMVEPSDGDQDPECVARLERGAVTIDEAAADIDHPNGTLDWIPVLPDEKARLTEAESAMHAMVEFAKSTAPTFNVNAAEVEVPTPVINVSAPPAPNVYMDTTAFADVLRELKDALIPKPREIVRDENGRIVGVR